MNHLPRVRIVSGPSPGPGPGLGLGLSLGSGPMVSSSSVSSLSLSTLRTRKWTSSAKSTLGSPRLTATLRPTTVLYSRTQKSPLCTLSSPISISSPKQSTVQRLEVKRKWTNNSNYHLGRFRPLTTTAAATTTTTGAGGGRETLLTAEHSSSAQIDPLDLRTRREKVVVLGSGWGGYIFSRRLSSDKYSCTVISPRSYFVFTPLLTDAAAGKLDFSSVVEPVRDQKAKIDYIQAAARSVDLDRKVVVCEACIVKSGVTESPRMEENERKEHLRKWEEGQVFEVPYDRLVIAVGAVSQTFKTPGVRENAMFFKDVGDAKRVKRRVRECFELAVLPTTTEEMQKYLLHFAIVGAGPTGTELAGTLTDFIHEEMNALYPAMKGKPKITLYDVAPNVLSMFDESLSRYAVETMKKQGHIEIKTAHNVEELRWGVPGTEGPHEMDPKGCLTLRTKQDGEVGIGMCVWATGNAMNEFVKYSLTDVDKFPVRSAVIQRNNERDPTTATSLPVENTKWRIKKPSPKGPLLVDGHFRVQLESRTGDQGQTAALQDVFAIGDNAAPETGAPPATAQATSQEAKWLADRFNKDDIDRIPPFSFRNLGTLAYIGNSKALMQLPHRGTGNGEGHGSTGVLPESIKGRKAWLIWKVAYLSMTISWRNRFRIVIRWMINRIFGTEISRF